MTKRDKKNKEGKRIVSVKVIPEHKGLQVSDHAVVRYLERGIGADIQELRNEILAQVAPKVKILGDGHYPIKNDVHAVVKSNVIVTVR